MKRRRTHPVGAEHLAADGLTGIKQLPGVLIADAAAECSYHVVEAINGPLPAWVQNPISHVRLSLSNGAGSLRAVRPNCPMAPAAVWPPVRARSADGRRSSECTA